MDDVCNWFALVDFLMNLEDTILDELCKSLQKSLWLKVLLDRTFSYKHLISTLKKEWNLKEDFDVNKIENGVMMFQFCNEMDVAMIENNGS